MISVKPFKIFYSAAQIWRKVVMQNFMTIPKMSLVRSLEVKFSSYGSNKVIKGVKMEIILIQYRICTICISVDWKFPSEFKYVHIEVIRGHLRGHPSNNGYAISKKMTFWQAFLKSFGIEMLEVNQVFSGYPIGQLDYTLDYLHWSKCISDVCLKLVQIFENTNTLIHQGSSWHDQCCIEQHKNLRHWYHCSSLSHFWYSCLDCHTWFHQVFVYTVIWHQKYQWLLIRPWIRRGRQRAGISGNTDYLVLWSKCILHAELK